jgi:hypothetical protein
MIKSRLSTTYELDNKTRRRSCKSGVDVTVDRSLRAGMSKRWGQGRMKVRGKVDKSKANKGPNKDGGKTNRRRGRERGPVIWTCSKRLEMRITFRGEGTADAPVALTLWQSEPLWSATRCDGRGGGAWTSQQRWRWAEVRRKSKRPPTFPGARRAGQGWRRVMVDGRR